MPGSGYLLKLFVVERDAYMLTFNFDFQNCHMYSTKLKYTTINLGNPNTDSGWKQKTPYANCESSFNLRWRQDRNSL